jgi:hypothetical protein
MDNDKGQIKKLPQGVLGIFFVKLPPTRNHEVIPDLATSKSGTVKVSYID